ncbi:AMP-binding protein [Rhizorhabdus argentea]|uniref:AMP-binding protein n=1 Tax=Rhizorhabdus argentea TaxID=1387174 RepID=UPI0030EF7A2F
MVEQSTMPSSKFFANPQAEVSEITVGDLLRECAKTVPHRVALKESPDPISGVQRGWTYAEILDGAERTARGLLTKFRPGDHVAIWAHNVPEWWFVEFGAALAGIVLVTINPASRQQEVAYILENSNAVGIITVRYCRGSDHLAMLADIRTSLPALRDILILDDWADFMNAAPEGTPLPQVHPADPIMIQYTSGTTGKPKGARMRHRGVVNSSKFATECFEPGDGAVWLNCVPMFHTGGSVHSSLGALWSHGTMILPPHFDPGVMLQMIEQERVTLTTTVPTMAIALLEHPSLQDLDLSSLKVLACGGAPVAPELVERIEREFGCDFVMLFGQTEMSGMICQTKRGDSVEHVTQTVGAPLGPTEVKIVDPQSGETLPVDRIGEICLRSSGVLQDYYGNAQATAEAIDPDGWFHTGDLGTVRTDRYLTITGRSKDMLIRGGENIYPREIEDELLAHPAISNVAVFGVPDAHWGEQIAVAVKLKGGHSADEQELRMFLQSRIAKFKMPKNWWFVDDFPTTTSGKVQKFELKNRFLALAHETDLSPTSGSAG